MIPIGLAKHATKLKFLVNENSTTILTGVGVVGTVATAYLAGRESFKAAEILQDRYAEIVMEDAAERNLTPENIDVEKISEVEASKRVTITEKAKLVWPQYLPAVGVGIITITSIVMAHRISSKKIAALIFASGVSERAFQEYKEKVIERLGERQDTKIRDEVAQDRVTNNPPSGEVVITSDGNVLCQDMLTGRYFRSTVESIKRAENSCNFELNDGIGVSLSRFYDELGLSPTVYTDSVGWFQRNPLEVQFSTTLSPDNQPCIAVSFARLPSPDYANVWT